MTASPFSYFFCLMLLRPPSSTRTSTFFPDTTRFLSAGDLRLVLLTAFVDLHGDELVHLHVHDRYVRQHVGVKQRVGALVGLVQRIGDLGHRRAIGRAHVCTPVTNAPLVCRLLLENKKRHTSKV